ncbi:sensor histidine kinase [Desulfolutivibrio sp.]|uniref:sensor histidine kinase n=1 Tax=Desulfolutivibrio sp. TaxID=2773296 RepID=UPI002F96D790
MKRLWCQLAISYTLLAFCALMLLIVIIYGLDDYNDYRTTLTPENIETLMISENLNVAQAIRDGDNTERLIQAGNNIREKLIHIEHGTGTTIYRITNSSIPEVYIQIYDQSDRLLISDPVDFPDYVTAQFAAQKNQSAATSNAKWLEENGPIWVDMPITDARDDIVGRLRILYIAKFNVLVQLKSVFDFLLFVWGYLFICSVPIGIICGLMASRYVTRQLAKINEVTESWRQGNFNVRIVLPNDDVFIRHSQYLNDMAQDLELYLSLKQRLAVSDERNRVARELHDTVKQNLFALGLQLATAKAKPSVMEAAREHILEAETITRQAQHYIMEIITQLRPSGTAETSFHQRIDMIADDFKRRFDVRIELTHFDPIQFTAHTEHHVLRIVQESLMNAVRHGKASKIAITSMVNQELVTLKIIDNGNGFDVNRKTVGFGITSMRDRVRDLPHGSFEIQSTPGVGTEITLSWNYES